MARNTLLEDFNEPLNRVQRSYIRIPAALIIYICIIIPATLLYVIFYRLITDLIDSFSFLRDCWRLQDFDNPLTFDKIYNSQPVMDKDYNRGIVENCNTMTVIVHMEDGSHRGFCLDKTSKNYNPLFNIP